MSKPPHRAFELDIHIGGDSWGAILRELSYLLSHIEVHGPECNSTSGSPSSNHRVNILRSPEMTHEKYFEALNAYLEKNPAGKGEA